MNNNDVLRRLRYAFDLADQKVIDLFGLGGLAVSRDLISNLMKKDDDPNFEPCSNVQLSSFLNGLIVKRRGLPEGADGPPPAETDLTNNTILRKLKIALGFKEGAMHEVMALAGMPLSRPEMSALFRRTDHKHYRECQDQILRNFLQGLQVKCRGGADRSKERAPLGADDTQKAPISESLVGVGEEFRALPGFEPQAEIVRALFKDGIETPSEPQRLAFEAILAGKSVVVDSGTGTGKTLAYLLPLLQRLARAPTERVVLLAPAAELAVQTLNVATRYRSPQLELGALVGGGNQRKQKARLKKGTRLIAGTPGRVLEMIAEKKLKGVTTFVLDEPEQILGSKDADFLVEVLSRPPRPQVVMAGATFGLNSERLLESLGDDVVRIKAEESPLVGLITHYRRRVRDAGDRDLQLVRFLEQENADRAIVYVNQSHLIRHVYRQLCDAEISVVTLSQDRSKQQCQKALREFSRGDAQVLLTTDRAATGIDVKGVPWVVHYEPPRSSQAYVHRAGRTGRAGLTGRCLVLIDDSERFILKGLERELAISFED